MPEFSAEDTRRLAKNKRAAIEAAGFCCCYHWLVSFSHILDWANDGQTQRSR